MSFPLSNIWLVSLEVRVIEWLQSIGVISSITEQEVWQNPMPKNSEICRNLTGMWKLEIMAPLFHMWQYIGVILWIWTWPEQWAWQEALWLWDTIHSLFPLYHPGPYEIQSGTVPTHQTIEVTEMWAGSCLSFWRGMASKMLHFSLLPCAVIYGQGPKPVRFLFSYKGYEQAARCLVVS